VAAFEAGDLDRSGELFEILVAADGDDALAAYYLGRIASDREDWDVAIARLERAIELGPVSPEVHAFAGLAYVGKLDTVGIFSQLGWARKARAAFLLAVELDPDNLDSRQHLLDYYIFAPGIAGGSTAKAGEQAEAIRERDPFLGHLAWAQVHEASDELDVARNDLRAAIALRPDDVDTRLRLVTQLHEVRRFEEAWTNLEAARAAAPDRPTVLYQMGRTADLSGKHLDAGAAALERYLEVASDATVLLRSWAWYRLGSIHMQAENEQAARQAFEGALRVDPEHDEARKALKKLR
jgi:tetratricopeptide (TPR) repeat protein